MSGTSLWEKLGNLSFRQDVTYTVWWNLLLITLGSAVFSFSVRNIATPHGFLPGGLFGLGTLFYYMSGLKYSPGLLYFLLSLPIFGFAWVKISRRFFWYSLFATVAQTVFYELLYYPLHIENQVYATMACGVLGGFGAGLVLRSLGSNGGLDIVAVYLFQRYNIGVGRVYLIFNAVLFSAGAATMSLDLVIASLFMVFITATTLEQTLALFSQRKVVFIISDSAEEISAEILHSLRQSATFLKGFGAYTRKEKNVLMTVVNNVQLKKLEEITFTQDPNALFIVENTFSVLGSSFSRRKLY